MNDSKSTFRPSFYFWMAVAIAVTAVVGFSRTFFLKHWTDAPPLPLAVHVHGLTATAFIVLFVVQTALIGGSRTAQHRRVGIGGLVLALLFFVSAFAAGIAMAHVRGETPEAIFRLALPFVVAPVFLLLVAAAALYRHRPSVHKRLMVLAAIEALTPALGRLPLVDAFMPLSFFAIAAAFLSAVPIHDWWLERRIPAATIWGGAIVLASLPGRVLLGTSHAWESFARQLLAVV